MAGVDFNVDPVGKRLLERPVRLFDIVTAAEHARHLEDRGGVPAGHVAHEYPVVGQLRAPAARPLNDASSPCSLSNCR